MSKPRSVRVHQGVQRVGTVSAWVIIVIDLHKTDRFSHFFRSQKGGIHQPPHLSHSRWPRLRSQNTVSEADALSGAEAPASSARTWDRFFVPLCWRTSRRSSEPGCACCRSAPPLLHPIQQSASTLRANSHQYSFPLVSPPTPVPQVGEEVTFSLGRNPNGRVVAQRIADAQDNPLPEVVKQQEDPEQSSVVGKKRKEADGHGQSQGGSEKQKQTRVALEDELPWLVLSSESSSSALSASAAEPDKDGDDSANDTTMIGQDQQSPMDKGEAGGESRDRDGSGDTVGAVLKRMVEGFRGNLQRWLSGQRLRAHLQQTLVQGELQQLRPRLRTILETHADLLPGNRGSSSPAVETALQVSLLNALAELHCSIKRDLVASLHTLRSMASNPVGGQQQQQQGGSNQAKRQKQSAPEAQPPEDGLKDPADILVEILRQCPAGIKTNEFVFRFVG